jgi:hypothetical protein
MGERREETIDTSPVPATIAPLILGVSNLHITPHNHIRR